MREPGHAHARGLQPVKIGQLAFEVLQAFDGEDRARDLLTVSPIRKQLRKVCRCLDEPQPPARIVSGALQFARMVERPFENR